MMIEIHRPELEALIRERMTAGAFQSVEDALMQALTDSPPPDAEAEQPKRTSADLIAAIQRSPYRELEVEPERCRMPVRDIAL